MEDDKSDKPKRRKSRGLGAASVPVSRRARATEIEDDKSDKPTKLGRGRGRGLASGPVSNAKRAGATDSEVDRDDMDVEPL